MKFVELPLFTDVYYNYAIGLEGARYVLTFLWNDRARSWHIDIHDENQSPIVLGVKLVSSFPMMADYAMQDKGLSGYFLLTPKTKDYVDISTSPGNISQYYRLLYIY